MYRREEAAAIKRAFWTSLGQYLKPSSSQWHEKVNWLNYKTGIKDIYLRMDADNKQASIAFELTHGDEVMRQLIFEVFCTLRPLLEAATGEPWLWDAHAYDEHGCGICRIGNTITGVNVMQQADWPAIISFLKPRLLAADAFWADAKDIIEIQL
jgi:hypothetical protein